MSIRDDLFNQSLILFEDSSELRRLRTTLRIKLYRDNPFISGIFDSIAVIYWTLFYLECDKADEELTLANLYSFKESLEDTLYKLRKQMRLVDVSVVYVPPKEVHGEDHLDILLYNGEYRQTLQFYIPKTKSGVCGHASMEYVGLPNRDDDYEDEDFDEDDTE